MNLDMNDKAAVQKQLWDDIEASRFGMLGVQAETIRMAPMTAFAERESHTLWFFTSTQTELASAAKRGVAASFVYLAKDQDLQACIQGDLLATHDVLHIAKYWSPVVAAWFPAGKDDQNLTLLRFTCAKADVWASLKGPVGFGWEIAKANMTGRRPEIGGHVALSFG